MNCYTREQSQKPLWLVKVINTLQEEIMMLILLAVRNSKTKNRVTNAFDDCITLSYKIEDKWQFHCFKCTTDPGTHWVENIMRKDGVAILKPGQYRGSHKLRLHQGKYLALGQKKTS